MKLNIKLSLALLIIQFTVITAFAQPDKKAIIGIWQLSQLSAFGNPFKKAAPGQLVIYNSDKTFTYLGQDSSGMEITNYGKYKIIGDRVLKHEYINKPHGPFDAYHRKGLKEVYFFSNDKKLLTIRSTNHSGITWTDVWRKL